MTGVQSTVHPWLGPAARGESFASMQTLSHVAAATTAGRRRLDPSLRLDMRMAKPHIRYGAFGYRICGIAGGQHLTDNSSAGSMRTCVR